MEDEFPDDDWVQIGEGEEVPEGVEMPEKVEPKIPLPAGKPKVDSVTYFLGNHYRINFLVSPSILLKQII